MALVLRADRPNSRRSTRSDSPRNKNLILFSRQIGAGRCVDQTPQTPRRVPPRPPSLTVSDRAYRVQPMGSKGGSRSRAAGAIHLEAMFHLAVETSAPQVRLTVAAGGAAGVG